MTDEQAIGTVVHLYVDGMAFGNYEGAVEWMSRDDFIAAILAEPPAQPGTQPLMDIEITDIEGDAAFVKVTDEFAGMRFSDYLSFLKIGGHWVIVNKLYHLHR
jgi:hypothetical protein